MWSIWSWLVVVVVEVTAQEFNKLVVALVLAVCLQDFLA
jgi:hypothetical protein